MTSGETKDSVTVSIKEGVFVVKAQTENIMIPESKLIKLTKGFHVAKM